MCIRDSAESRERMMEQSYRMAARYLSPKPEATPGAAEEEEKPEPAPVSRAAIGTTSALEDVYKSQDRGLQLLP